MATITWRGDAPAVAQLNTITPANVASTNVFNVVINGKTVSFIATANTVANVTAGLVAAITASTIPEFKSVTAVDNATTLTLTANDPGVPFTQTSSATGGTATLVTAVTTTSSGPNDLNIAANWTGGVLPTNADDVWFTNSSVSAMYNLGALSAVTLASLNIDSTFTGAIGLPRYNASGGYLEYRATYLAIGATLFNIFAGSGSGSGRIKVNFGTVQTTATITATGSSSDQGLPAVILKGTHASNVINIQQGTLGVALEPGDVSTVATIRIGSQQSPATDVTLTLGVGCTLTTITQNGGTLVVQSAVTTHTLNLGSATYLGAMTVTTLSNQGGTVYYNTSGTATTVTIGTGATVDCSRDPRARTWTNCTIVAGGTLLDPYKTITFTNPFLLQNCSLSEVTLDLGSNFSLARS